MHESRAVLSITKSTDILDHIYSLPEPEQTKAMEDVRAIERRAMISQKPQPGLEKLMDYLAAKEVQKAICTRNFDTPVTHLLETFVPDHRFHPIMQVTTLWVSNRDTNLAKHPGVSTAKAFSRRDTLHC
jgi:phosphoglycolate phosphatase-like HAD superfamily hydrolase